jgi:two-component system LytT family sensor kinase
VTLEEELDINERYLELASARFEERLRVQMDIDPRTLAALVPDFILQPLVENAVKYGTATADGQSLITLRSSIDNNHLCLEVENQTNGGISDEEVTGTGYGHRLVDERLKRLFGSDYSFTLTPKGPSGMLVALSMPLQYDSGKGK